jgi:hypothetical protein
MRAETDRGKIEKFMTTLGERAGGPGRNRDALRRDVIAICRGKRENSA